MSHRYLILGVATSWAMNGPGRLSPIPTPNKWLAGPAALVEEMGGPFTVIVSPDVAKRWRMPAHWRETTVMPDVLPADWTWGVPAGWVTARREDGMTVWFCFWAWCAQYPSPAREWPLYGDLVHADPFLCPDTVQGLLGRLRAWETYSGGHRYQGTPGITGSIMLRAVCAAKRKRPLWHFPVPQGASSAGAVELVWSAPGHVPGRHLLRYDRRSSYLASMVTALYAPGPLEHTRLRELDADQAGWWKVDADLWPYKDVPDPLHGYAGLGGVWVTTPRLQLLQELADTGRWGGFVIRDSWTAPGEQLLREWGGVLRDIGKATTGKDDPVSSAVRDHTKEAFRQTNGLFARGGGSIYRPDWYATTVDHTAACVLRTTYKVWNWGAGPAPVRINVDEIGYASDDPDPVRANPGITFRTTIGGWRAKATLDRGARYARTPA